MHPYRHALLSALDALDAAFAAEPALPVTGCAYCWGEEYFAELSGPLDALSEETILGVAMEVSDHWNDFPRLYRRLTPLLVRRAVLGGEHGVPADVVASRLREAGCLEWAPGLTDALRAVGAAWWRAVLHGEVRGAGGNPDAGEALGVLTVASGTVRPWLGIWAATRTPYADALLAEYIAQLPYSVGDLGDGWWDGDPRHDPRREVAAWLLRDVRDRLDGLTPDDVMVLNEVRRTF
ncbi:hypothetical protein [Streptomyces sp. NEAU-H3]|uniref:hypothetical protein n=1 Tax=Streptomyces sp. NEAU-H3 TaxID=2720636 RepID=UPI00143C5480|nr:hypothetical protein [Streptomyces sp. NEAU-H3]NJA60354.1 hypothetical protein [Streptomyces sp. NEAU-H3]